MRRILCFILILCCLMSIVGCNKKGTAPDGSVTVYYRREKPVYNTSDGVLAPTYLDATGHEQDHAYLLNKYLQTTPGDGFARTFPSGTVLISFKLEGLTAKVVLSDRIAEFTGLDLTIALTCLTQTIMTLTDCEEVIISARSKQLDGQNYVTLSKDSYLLVDDSGTASEN